MQETYITGSTGFVGKHLTDRLVDVVSIPHQEIMYTDFSKATRVFFLSTYGNMSYHSGLDDIVQANVTDLTHTLSTIDWSNITSFVYYSTSSVKLRTQTAYSRTKRASEEILLAYMERYDAPITIIRPMSITGVGEQERHLIPILIDSIYNDKPVNLVPEPVHDFIDVSDIVSGTLNLSDVGARGIFELGTGVGYKNIEVLRIVEDVMGKKAKVNMVQNLRPYDNDNWVSTNFRSRGWGWSPQKTLRDSIEEMVKEYVK